MFDHHIFYMKGILYMNQIKLRAVKVPHFLRAMIIAVLGGVATTQVHADYETEYVWYRALPKENRIVITSELLKGHQAVDNFKASAKANELEGKYHTYIHGEHRSIKKVETMNGHTFRSEIEIVGPRGHGRDGAIPNVWLKLYIDEILRVDCPLGQGWRLDMRVPRIVVCTDEQYLGITATYLTFDGGGQKYLFINEDAPNEKLVVKEDALVIEGASVIPIPSSEAKAPSTKFSGGVDTHEIPGAYIAHIVYSGETLQQIAKIYGVTEESIRNVNKLDPGTQLTEGMRLRILIPTS